MRVNIPGMGMYMYLLPALTAWAVRMGYEMPDTTDEHLVCYYTDSMNTNTRGCHQYHKGNTIISIRPGIESELSTWAHEFAHMIQSVNLGRRWRTSYDVSTEDNGYWNNVFEVEARECGKMTTLFEEQGWLFWEIDYNEEGKHSTWPRPKGRSLVGWYYDERYCYIRSHDVVPWWESDYVQHYVPLQQLYVTLINIILKTHTGYTNHNAVLNMQQYAA